MSYANRVGLVLTDMEKRQYHTNFYVPSLIFLIVELVACYGWHPFRNGLGPTHFPTHPKQGASLSWACVVLKMPVCPVIDFQFVSDQCRKVL